MSGLVSTAVSSAQACNIYIQLEKISPSEVGAMVIALFYSVSLSILLLCLYLCLFHSVCVSSLYTLSHMLLPGDLLSLLSPFQSDGGAAGEDAAAIEE